MRNGEWSKLVSVAGRILLAFLFVFSQSAWAGEDPKAKDNPKPTEKAVGQQTGEKTSSVVTPAKTEVEDLQAESAEKSAAEERPSGNGQHEGIKVHGHWTIEVRNPDGSLATRRVFENAYTPTSFLASLLARQASVGFWSVGLNGTNTVPAPCLSSGQPGACVIFEAGASAAGLAPSSNLFTTLTVNANANSLVLAGTATVGQTGAINLVSTTATSCPNSTPPSTPCIGQAQGFTLTGIAPISVSLGQLVSVTVVISFS
jgi:hypothetical protein